MNRFLTVVGLVFSWIGVANVAGARGASAPFQCFVISGIHGESTSLFSDYRDSMLRKMNPNLDQFYFNHFSCQKVISWTHLEMKVAELPKKTRLLIVQSAHGTEGGVCDTCEGGPESGSSILKAMNRIAEKHKTTVILDSCYAGDVLALKLLDDEMNPRKKEIDHLCLQTSSGFGDLDYYSVVKDLDAFDPAQDSPEKLFAKSADTILTSSLPWESTGLIPLLVPASDQSSAHALLNAESWGFPRGTEPSEACAKLAEGLSVLLDEAVTNGSVDPNGRTYCDWFEEYESGKCEAAIAEPLARLAKDSSEPGKLFKPEAIQVIFKAVLAAQFEFDHGNLFDETIKAWAEKAMRLKPSHPLDIKRKRACKNW